MNDITGAGPQSLRMAKTTFGKNLRRFRRASGLTQANLAEAVGGQSKGYISDLENEKKVGPSLKLVRSLALALGCDVTDLISDDDEFVAEVAELARKIPADGRSSALRMLRGLSDSSRTA